MNEKCKIKQLWYFILPQLEWLKSWKQILEGVWEKGETSVIASGIKTRAAILDSSVENSQTAKKLNLSYNPLIPLLGIFPKDEIFYCKYSCSAMSTGILFIIAETWKQPKYLSAADLECSMNMLYIYTTK